MVDKSKCANRRFRDECVSSIGSSRLEEEHSHLSHVEIDEMLGLMGDIGAEVPAHNAVPGGVVLLVKLLLDVGGDVLLDVVLLQSLGRTVNSVLKI